MDVMGITGIVGYINPYYLSFGMGSVGGSLLTGLVFTVMKQKKEGVVDILSEYVETKIEESIEEVTELCSQMVLTNQVSIEKRLVELEQRQERLSSQGASSTLTIEGLIQGSTLQENTLNQLIEANNKLVNEFNVTLPERLDKLEAEVLHKNSTTHALWTGLGQIEERLNAIDSSDSDMQTTIDTQAKIIEEHKVIIEQYATVIQQYQRHYQEAIQREEQKKLLQSQGYDGQTYQSPPYVPNANMGKMEQRDRSVINLYKSGGNGGGLFNGAPLPPSVIQ